MNADDKRARIRERDRAVQARVIVESPLWDEVYRKLIDAELSRMLSNSASEDETLECKRRILALNEVKLRFTEILQTGQLAEMQLEREKNG